jgi:Tfp pilus assembly protein PilE
MCKIKRYNFSLIELVAATAIFAILMVLVMNMFSSALDILSKNASNTKMSAAAQTTLDYLEERLINCDKDTLKDNFIINDTETLYPVEGAPLKFKTSVNISDSIDLNERRYGEFSVKLQCPANDDDWSLQVKFDSNDSAGKYNEDFTTILGNVTNFIVSALDSGMQLTKSDICYVKVDILVLSPDDFATWYADGKDYNSEFYKEKVFIYSRIIALP